MEKSISISKQAVYPFLGIGSFFLFLTLIIEVLEEIKFSP